MRSWNDVRGTLISAAELDLRLIGDVQPSLVAFHGGAQLFVATLRPFTAGYVDPIIEVVALACPLGADRLALSLGGRAWSPADPIVPACAEGDLRQRVVVIHEVDGHRTDVPRVRTTLVPFDLHGDGGVRFGEPVEHGDGEGWIVGALEAVVHGRAQITGTTDEVRDQAARCEALGHRLVWSIEGARRLETSIADRASGVVTRDPSPGSPRRSPRGSTGRRGPRRSPHR